jgi:hypothetical protein
LATGLVFLCAAGISETRNHSRVKQTSLTMRN